MLNPTSLKSRGLDVADSRAAVLLDHEIAFFGPNGYMAPLPCSGKSMDGVLHRLSDATLAKLEPLLAGSSDLQSVQVRVGGEVHAALTHVLSREKMPTATDQPPLEAYIAILLEGARHFGLPKPFEEALLAQEARPRRTPSQFTSFAELLGQEQWAALPAGWTLADVAAKSAEALCSTPSDTSKDIYLAFNTKVCKYIGPRDGFHNWPLYKGAFLAQQAVFSFSKIQYDPKYGLASSWEAMSDEARAFYEDWMFEAFGGTAGAGKALELVGKLA